MIGGVRFVALAQELPGLYICVVVKFELLGLSVSRTVLVHQNRETQRRATITRLGLNVEVGVSRGWQADREGNQRHTNDYAHIQRKA
jgi:hypothetical protein